MGIDTSVIWAVIIFFAVFGTGTGYLMRVIRVGPVPVGGARQEHGGPGQDRHPMRPLSASSEENDQVGSTTSSADTTTSRS